ncbi:hypothetical protein BGZ95_004209 [Linnemannia exigua]|uniref:Uncharacterized protein n=1 Tax=Linnemannia exigua TaxID=604196 RepID=A0AAD4H1Y3_9FUNG|nr:hypothetical protein BGZ95_004209 [Linnemannia exigua]
MFAATADMTTCTNPDCDAPSHHVDTLCEDHLKQAQVKRKPFNDKFNAESKRGKLILRVLLESVEGRAIVAEIEETKKWPNPSTKETTESNNERNEERTADDKTKAGLASNQDTKEENVNDVEKNKEMQEKIDELTAQLQNLQKLKDVVKEAVTILSTAEKL